MLSKNLKATLRKALAIAYQYHHEYATYEHLLLSLLDNAEVKKVFKHYKIDSEVISKKLYDYLERDLNELVSETPVEAKLIVGFNAIVQKAAVHGQANGQQIITGVHLLAEFFLEHESYYTRNCLKQNNLTRRNILLIISLLLLMKQKNRALPPLKPKSTPPAENAPQMISTTEIDNSKLCKAKSTTSKTASENQSAFESFCVNLNLKTEEGDVPDILKKSIIYLLDIGSLVAR